MSKPHRLSALVLVASLACPMAGTAAAEPAAHASSHASKPGSTAPGPVAVPTPRLAATIPARPTGPLDTPSHAVTHPDRQLIETLALAGSRVLAGGASGLLILSDDNGVTWRQVSMPVSVTLTDIRFTDERTGWAVGHDGAVLRSDDGGEHWTLVFDGARAAQATLAAARIANAADGVRDREVKVAEALARSDPDRPFLLIQTKGLDTVRLIGADGLAVGSADGGRHWLPWSDGIDNPDRLPLDGLAERNGYALAAGGHGILLGGLPSEGLHSMKSPYDGSFFGVIDAGRYGLMAFGQQGHAFASSDPGPDLATREVVWHRVADPSSNALTAGLLRQDGSVLLGDAAGATWQLAGKPETPRLEPAHAEAPFPILAMAEAADRSVILAGPGGVLRFGPEPVTVPAVAPATPAIPSAAAIPPPAAPPPAPPKP